MGVQNMSAVYGDVKKKATPRPSRVFTTLHGEPVESGAGIFPEYSPSSLGQYFGSAFSITGAVFLYALHGEPDGMGDRAKIVPVRGGQIFPLVGQTHTTSTMSLGGAWVASEPEVYNSGVVNLPWARKVIFSGKVQFKTAQLPRRAPRTIVGGSLADEGNG